MIYVVLLVFTVHVLITVSFDPSTWKLADPLHYEDPTPAEIMRAFSKKGHECWGQQMRMEGDVRLLMIGGSQTAEVEDNNSGLSNLIHEYLQKTFGPKSYALNRGRGSALPKSFIGSKYDFEKWETSLWPNCVMLDFTLNSLPDDGWSTARDAEKVIRSIKHKYLVRGLRIPDFFFIDYLMIYGFDVDERSGKYNTSDLRLQRINRLSTNVTDSFFAGNGFDRGCASCAFLNELADFHGYPVVSIRNALYPGFQRFHLSSKPKDIDIYYLSADGIHLSIWGRCFVINYIFTPFWKRVMAPRKELPMRSPYSHIYDADLTLMAVEPINMELERWTSWGNEGNTLINISSSVLRHGKQHVSGSEVSTESSPDAAAVVDGVSHSTSGWSFISTFGHEDDEGHICYGSNDKSSVAVFNFTAPIECSAVTPCELQISAVHSWNRTHYGDMTCALYGENIRNRRTGLLRGKKKERPSVSITAQVYNGRTLRNTLPLDITIDRNITAGQYFVQCAKNDMRYSCVSSIRISQVLVI